MSAACRDRRTWGSVGRGRLFLGAAAQAALFLAQEDESGGDQGQVMVEALPAASFEVIQPEFDLALNLRTGL